jgi:mono/diheme cytochrome c family protein
MLPRYDHAKFAMKKAAAKWLLVAIAMIGFHASGWAEDVDAGKKEYLSNCADCHGPDGKGAGLHATKLTTKPADLTIIAKKNNGIFPLAQVYETIDGRNVTESHNADDMPIWGCRHTPPPISTTSPKPKTSKPNSPKVFKPDSYESHLDLACDPEDVIGNRILSVVDYLRRIQEK